MTVLPEGPEQAKIMLIGEAPGETEEKEGRPFCGVAGKVLNGILEECGIKREEVRVSNVMQERPPGNNFDHFYTKNEKGKKVPSVALLESYARLQSEIAACSPNVIVPLGNEAMKAILGYSGVMNYRGSILSSNLGKCIPTIHPASIARQWSFRPAVVADFQRIKEQSEFPEIIRTPQKLSIAYSTQAALEALEEVERTKYAAFDIETETDQITCISFSWEENQAVSIPFWFAGNTLRNESDELVLWRRIRDIMGNAEIKKVAHNGAYDIEFLQTKYGIRTEGYVLDTMVAFHVLYLELPKGLDFLCSLYTDLPYYKHEINTEDMDTYFTYNAKDSLVTFLCAKEIEVELRERNLFEFYQTHMHRLIFVLLDMQLRGVRFDTEMCAKLRKEIRHEVDALTEEFKRIAGDINPASPKQLTEWLYTKEGYPKQLKKDKATGKVSITANEEALETCRKIRANPAIDTLLLIREKSKLLSTYLEVKLDDDRRIRCAYNITGTETGRLSSSATARGTGTNLQNIPNGDVKRLFLADEGKTLLNADLSQAEARVVACLAGEERLIRLFEEGGDIHRRNASVIFRKKELEVTDEERQLAKRVIHASNYGMGPVTFSKNAGIPVSEARRLLNQYFATYPRIKVWHMQIQNLLKNTRRLRAPSGRERVFFNRFDESLTKEGLAFIPQETVGTIVNDALIELYEDKEHKLELLLQVHDSILCQCPLSWVGEGIDRLKRAMLKPIKINSRTLLIPVDVKVGSNWKDMVKV
jgi:DNA polymerase-1